MCKRPLKGFQIGLTDKGKPHYKIVSYKTDHIEYFNGKWRICFESFVSPYSEKCVTAFTEIPCGKCVECRLNYSRQWADRCMFEYLYHPKEECWFLTLTLDDEHIMDVDSDIFAGTLIKSDLSAFIKRLRRHCEYHSLSDGIRFYACGEYGSKTARPHYHMILYGLDLIKYDHLSKWVKSKSGFWTWRSPLLEKIWQKGMVVVAPVSWDTCAYTARYVMKKVGGLGPDDYIKHGVEPEFVLMSRRPGIGSEYFDDNYKQIYKYDEIYVSSPDGGRRCKPPKAYDRKFEEIDPVRYAEIKEKRKQVADQVRRLKMEQTGLSITEIFEIEEKVLTSKLKLLPRSLI